MKRKGYRRPKGFLFQLIGTCFVIMCCVKISFALVISEIQFDPAGSDTDREWVEIYNDTNNTVDLTLYKFAENNTNHGIEVVSGDKNLVSGEYAVLVQDLSKFKSDFPDYTGKIFKSSFSLSNSGELLGIKDKEGNTLNSVTYSPSATGASNGSTINFDGNVYVKGNPTPGSGTLSVNPNAQTGNENNSNTSTTTSTTTSQTTGTENVGTFTTPTYYYRSYYPESEKIYVYAGENQVGVSGADFFFFGKAVTGDKRAIGNATFFWSFGDGETGEGDKVRHVYKFPGEYVVNLEGYANGSRSEDRIYIKVSPPQLKISLKEIDEEKVVQIENKSKEQVDIGGYLIRTTGGEFEKTYTIGKRLTILPGKSTVISQDVIKFATSTSFVTLAFSNGKIISEFNSESPITLSTSTKARFISLTDATNTIVSSNIKVFTVSEFEQLRAQVSTQTQAKVVLKKVTNPKISIFASNASELAVKTDKIIERPKEKVESNVFEINNKTSGFWGNILNYLGI